MSGTPSPAQLAARIKDLEAEVVFLRQRNQSLAHCSGLFGENYQSLPFPYLLLARDGTVLDANQQWLDLFEYSREEIMGRAAMEILRPDEVERFQTTFLHKRRGGDVAKDEFRLLRKKGDPVDVAITWTIAESSPESFPGACHLFFDARKTAGIGGAPRSTRDIWARTFDAIDDFVTIQDKNLNIIKANRATCAFFQLKESDLQGRRCHELFSGSSEPCRHCPLLASLQSGGCHCAVISHEKLGKVFQVNSSIIPAKAGGGEEYLVHVARDITAEIERETRLQESNERFEKAFQRSPAPMVISEIDTGLYLDVNRQWLEMLGYTMDEVLGRTSREIGVWRNPAARDQMVARLSQNSAIHNYPVTFLTKAGEPRSVLWSAEKITIHGKKLLLSLINDITEQIKVETRLRESEEKFALAFNASPDAININRLENGLYVDINEGFTKLTGFGKDDVCGRTSADINIWVDPSDRQRLVESLKKQGYCENLEADFRRKDGSVTTALMSARVISLNNVPHILSITRDIGRLRKIERQVLEQKLLFETMFHAIDDGVVITDTKRRIIYANQGMERTFGYTPDELRGNSAEMLYSGEENYQVIGREFFQNDNALKDRFFITSYRHKSGREFPGETFGVRLHDQNNTWIGNLGIMRDVTQRQKAEAERERLIAAIEQTREAIVITDSDANIQYVNPAFELVTGYSLADVLGHNPRILKSGEQDAQFYQDMWQALKKGETFQCRMVNRRKDGGIFTEEATISPVFDRTGRIVNYVAVKRDITEQIQLESHLRQAQKMEAVGRLTGGVAHDFNNILSVIIGYSEMALDDLSPGHKLHGDLSKILEAARRSADIVRQLLAFSRKQAVSPKVIDLNSAVTQMLKILKRLIGEDIELLWLPAPALLQIKIDPVQIDQILANLCVNAKDAITGAGTITIETARASFDSAYCASHIGFHPGEFVQLSISDNGSGIDKKDQPHIFEPFFSTKALGQGTGLGLSTVYGIVKQNSGFINVYSEPGQGTTFKIYLPYVPGERQAAAEKSSMASAGSAAGETILIVEDEPALLSMAQNMLEGLGYAVLTANRPSEGLKIARRRSGVIDLVFTDVIMPEMTGKEMAGLIQALHPRAKVLFMSGYTANVIVHNGFLDDGIEFIQKPYSKDELALKIRKILDRNDPVSC